MEIKQQPPTIVYNERVMARTDTNANFIEINPELENHPKIFNFVLNHELEHYYRTKSDFLIDLDVFCHPIKTAQVLFLTLRTPKTWAIFLPLKKNCLGDYSTSKSIIFPIIFITSLALVILI